ncbi:MAG: D-aminoacyl-tRNA deacylase [Anaerolineales bacterium]
MKVVLQRVSRGAVSVGEEEVASIESGVVLLVGIGPADDEEKVDWLAHKIATLRVFEDDEGKTNLSLQDVGGEALVISQFTLYADVSKGRRPSFTHAAAPEIAEPLVAHFAEELQSQGIPTKSGEFGAHMLVEIENDGPVTILLER